MGIFAKLKARIFPRKEQSVAKFLFHLNIQVRGGQTVSITSRADVPLSHGTLKRPKKLSLEVFRGA